MLEVMLHLPQTPKSQLSHFVHSHREMATPLSYFDAELSSYKGGSGKKWKDPTEVCMSWKDAESNRVSLSQAPDICSWDEIIEKPEHQPE